MNNTIIIDATAARNDFFNLLDKVYMRDKTYVIKKAGIPVAELKKPKIKTKDDILRFAGIWKDAKAKKLLNYVYAERKDYGKIGRKLPKIGV